MNLYSKLEKHLPREKEVCKDCEGYGWTGEHDTGTYSHDENGECVGCCPVQIPCETCEGKDDRDSIIHNQCKSQYDEALKRVVVDEEVLERIFFMSEIYQGHEHNFCGCDSCESDIKDLIKAIANSPDVIKVEEV